MYKLEGVLVMGFYLLLWPSLGGGTREHCLVVEQALAVLIVLNSPSAPRIDPRP
jgi:hypothetical protein